MLVLVHVAPFPSPNYSGHVPFVGFPCAWQCQPISHEQTLGERKSLMKRDLVPSCLLNTLKARLSCSGNGPGGFLASLWPQVPGAVVCFTGLMSELAPTELGCRPRGLSDGWAPVLR